MEKEMKKLLLVAVSVGVFLLVTITVALIVLTPRAQNESYLSSSPPYSQGRILPAPEANESEQTFFDFNDIPYIDVTEITPYNDKNNGDSLTIHVTAPVSTLAPENTVQAKKTSSSTVTAAASAAQKQNVSSSASRTSAPAASASRTIIKSAPAKTINDYWIQIGAYRAIIRAEDARELLASKGLVSIIENREINGQNLYRVRLGPYTSEREANHWLAIVRNIDGFNESQVRQTIR